MNDHQRPELSDAALDCLLDLTDQALDDALAKVIDPADAYHSILEAHTRRGISSPLVAPDLHHAGSSTVRRIMLGALLRHLREFNGISMRIAGYRIRSTESKISRMETGRSDFKERDVADLLTYYGVIDRTERDKVIGLVREAYTLGWWQSFTELMPPWFDAFVSLEATASVVRTYEVQFIPGLLQCHEYSKAIASANRMLSKADLNRRIELRLRRQLALERGNGPHLWVVLDEAAVRRPVGDSSVMEAQIRYLIDQASKPNITIQLMPYTVGAHAAQGGAFTILRFGEMDIPDIVYLEHLAGAQFVENSEEVEQYMRAIERICVEALPPEQTVTAFESLIKDVDS